MNSFVSVIRDRGLAFSTGVTNRNIVPVRVVVNQGTVMPIRIQIERLRILKFCIRNSVRLLAEVGRINRPMLLPK